MLFKCLGVFFCCSVDKTPLLGKRCKLLVDIIQDSCNSRRTGINSRRNLLIFLNLLRKMIRMINLKVNIQFLVAFAALLSVKIFFDHCHAPIIVIARRYDAAISYCVPQKSIYTTIRLINN